MFAVFRGSSGFRRRARPRDWLVDTQDPMVVASTSVLSAGALEAERLQERRGH